LKATNSEITRFVGIRHRRKATKEGEARPTSVAIRVEGKDRIFDLQTETDELDFLMNRFPVEWRDLKTDEKIIWHSENIEVTGFRTHHCKWRKLKRTDDTSSLDPQRILTFPDGSQHYLLKVPSAFEGLRAGDVVGMVLGGSGDRFASALSRRGESVNATVWRIPPYALMALRGETNKEDDHLTLARLVREHQDMFYLLRLRDRESIRVKEALDIRQQAMKARIGCEQRMLQALVGRVFLSEEGHFLEGVIEDEFDRLKANDQIFLSLEAEEHRRDRELEKAVRSVGIWKAIFKPIQGCGPRLAAGLIAPIGDIRRFLVEPNPQRMEGLYTRSRQLERDGQFERDRVHVTDRTNSGMPHYQVLQIVRSWQATHGRSTEAQLLTEAIVCHEERHKLRRAAHNKGKAKLRAFCGVHCIEGKFARRRAGVVSNWNPAARQALYLLGDQFNRRPDSVWGKKLLENKLEYRRKHPTIECSLCGVPWEQCTKGSETTETVVGKHPRKYTDGHIHKMAIWKTLTQFTNALFEAWTRLEKQHNGHVRKEESAAA
jgi:hypothetical protein